jgi:hypothetical protein
MTRHPRPTSELLIEAIVPQGTRESLNRETATRSTTGFDKIDPLLEGFSGGEIVLVASDTPDIAEHFIYQMATNLALNADRRVLLYSPQKTASAVMQHMLSTRSSISLAKFEAGNFSAEDLVNLYDTVKTFATNNVAISDAEYENIDFFLRTAKPYIISRDVDVVLAAGAVITRSHAFSKISTALQKPLFLNLSTPNSAAQEASTVVISLKSESDQKVVGQSRVSKNGRTEFFSMRYEPQYSRLTQTQ